VDGTLLHLWHGDDENRNYVNRLKTLAELKFNPTRDIVLDEKGCWKWDQNTSRLKESSEEYFALRKEDK